MKQKSVYLCSDCGYESPKWFGKCPSCGAWNTISEFKIQPESAARGTNSFPRGASRPVPLSEIESGDEARFHSGIGELDRVLGGGAVHGSFVLVGGEPGIGKSTLLVACRCARRCAGTPRCCMYRGRNPSGRSSCARRGYRFPRRSYTFCPKRIWSRSSQETERMEPDILIVDSIQYRV